MSRTCFVISLCTFLLTLLAGSLSAQDSGSGIVFTGCPPYVQGNHCDSMFYQVVAVDVSTGQQCPQMKYMLISGPGTINQKTGLWVLYPEMDSLPSHYHGEVEIAAYKGNDTTTSDENCRFDVHLQDYGPVIRPRYGARFTCLPGDTEVVSIDITDRDWCDVPEVDSLTISPEPVGNFEFDTAEWVMRFAPDLADSGSTFEARFKVSSGRYVVTCIYYFDAFWPEATYSVRIGYLDEVYQGVFTDVPVTLEEFDHTKGLGGFDLLVVYDASALAFQLANEGDLYDSCGWEYFTYRFGANPGCGDACPSGMLRLVGIAETNNGPYYPNPDCQVDNPGWVSTVPVTLALMRFLVSNDRTLECQFVPIRFFWVDCGDNTLSNYSGNELYLSALVHEYPDILITSKAEYPTYFGAQDECMCDGRANPTCRIPTHRAVDFYNGGLQIVCGDTISCLGDVNLNGLPFEIADAVMLSNYFMYGPPAFGSHAEQSLVCSDLNSDGQLTVADLVYMMRVGNGDAEPQTEPSPNPAHFVWDVQAGTVTVSSIDSLGAIYLVIEGEITPTLLADQMKMKFTWDTGWTRILVYSMEPGTAVTSGDVVLISGATGIVEIQAATFEARAVTTELEISDSGTEATYAVRIGYLDDVLNGTFINVPVTLEKFDHTQGLGGYDFLISYNASALLFTNALPGDLLESCAWEYFTYRFGANADCGGPCPIGILRVIGIAETNISPVRPDPDCQADNPGWVSAVPTTLAELGFVVTNDLTFECNWVPIRFFWYDCGDNTLANYDGTELYLSANVYDYNGYGDVPVTGVEPFPTYRGAQNECLSGNPYVTRRAVDFYNGGLQIACADSIEYNCDINCNGLSFEIADAIMFSNFFVEGLAAFGGHVECSIDASDVNRDGKTLTVEDFVYIVRVIIGDVQPQKQPSPNQATFTWDTQTSAVSVSSIDSLGAVYLIVEGEITPTLLADQMEMKYGWDTGWTRILVYSMDAGRAITSGEFLRIHGATGIVSVEAATFDARAVTEIISGTTDVDDNSGNLPLQFALHSNYPNPFNPSTTILYDLPEQARVQIAVYNVVGQVVRTLVDAQVSPGQHQTIWDGRDDSGHQVSSGLYLYRMTAGDYTQSRKMLLLK